MREGKESAWRPGDPQLSIFISPARGLLDRAPFSVPRLVYPLLWEGSTFLHAGSVRHSQGSMKSAGLEGA